MEKVMFKCKVAVSGNVRSDPVVLAGPLIAKRFYGTSIPVVNLSEDDYAKLEGAKEVEFFEEGNEIAVYY